MSETFRFCDGKYEVTRDDDSRVTMLRHGEPWPAGQEMFLGSKFLHSVLDQVEDLRAENKKLRVEKDPSEVREMLRAMQAGELTVSRGVELLDMWLAGNYSDDLLPPVRQDLIEEDSMPVEIIDRLKGRVQELISILHEVRKWNVPFDFNGRKIDRIIDGALAKMGGDRK